MVKQIFKIKREYEEAKKVAVEHVVNNLESRTSKIIVIFLFAIIAGEWFFAVFASEGLEVLSDKYGLGPISIPFLTSYFFFFHFSKFIFRPTDEEILDDTSMFAIFSACNRKEKRSLISMGLSILHTLVFALLLVNKDLEIF